MSDLMITSPPTSPQVPHHRIVSTPPGPNVAYVVGTRVIVGSRRAEQGDDRTTFCAVIVEPGRVGRLTTDVTTTLASTEHMGDPMYRDLGLLRRLSRGAARCVYARGRTADSEEHADRQRAFCYYALIEALAAARVGQIVMTTTTYPRIRRLDIRTHAEATGNAITLRYGTSIDDPILEMGYALDWALRHDRDRPARLRIVPRENLSRRLHTIDVDC